MLYVLGQREKGPRARVTLSCIQTTHLGHTRKRQAATMERKVLWVLLLALKLLLSNACAQALTGTAAKKGVLDTRSGRGLKYAEYTEESSDAALIQDIELLLELAIFVDEYFSTTLPAFDNNGNLIQYTSTSGYSDINNNSTVQQGYVSINNVCSTTMSSYSCGLQRPSFSECNACGSAQQLSQGTESGQGWGGIIRLVYVTSNNIISMSCSGWLLEPTLVATAGHCVWDAEHGTGWFIDTYSIIAYSRYNGASSKYSLAQVVKTWTTNTFANNGIPFNSRLSDGADLGLMKLSIPLSTDTYSWKGSNGGSALYKAYGYPAEFQYAPGSYMYFWYQNLTIETGCPGFAYMFCSTIGVVGGMSGGPLFEAYSSQSYVVGSMSSGSMCYCRTYHTPVEGQYSISSLVTAAGCTANCASGYCTATCPSSNPS